MNIEIASSKIISRRFSPALCAFAAVVAVSGCNSGSKSTVVTDPAQAINMVAAKSADSDPSAADAALQNSMDAVFGNADADPVDVLEGDTFASFSDRAASL